jgi:signal transduction histidine kinase
VFEEPSEAASSEPISEQQIIPSPAVPARVMVVDDEPVIADFFTKLFEPSEFDVATWPSAEAALAEFAPGMFELAILDKNLRGMNGIELMRELRDRDPLLEVIVITGYASLETAIQALQLGAFDYIEKPFPDIVLLVQKAKRAVERRRLSVTNLKLVEYLRRTNRTLTDRNAELVWMQEQLLAQLRLASVGQLAAWMGEEIINPVSIIKTNLYLLDDQLRGLLEGATSDPRTEDAKGGLAEMKAEIERLTGMIRRMQHFSVGARSEQRPVDLQGCLEQAIEFSARHRTGRDIAVRADVGPDLPNLRGAPALLMQAFLNLLQNSIEAIENEGLVEIQARAVEGGARVVIHDTGTGIPRENLTRILKPFFTTKETGQHVGLGLNLAEEIVRRHGGTLRVESAQGKGTSVIVSLPAAEEP